MRKNKTYMMQVRFTDDEIQALKQVAESMETTLSNYVRSQVFKPAKVRSLITRKQKGTARKGGNKVAILGCTTAEASQ